MSRPKRDQTITIQVDAETKAKARRLAEDSCRTLSGFVRQLLRFHIREYEFLYGPIRVEEPDCPLSPGAGHGTIMPAE